jgi:hypothetical protein
MILTMEYAQPVTNATAKDVERALRKLKLTGRHEFAVLEDDHGNYVQVAGGGAACMIERRSVQPFHHYRAFQDRQNKAFPDGTKLRFAGSEVPMMSNEWFTIDQVVEVFLAFHAGAQLPDWIRWRDITNVLYPPG